MSFINHIYQTIALALPMIIARAGLLVMVAVDTAMVGHYGTEPLAFYAASNAMQIVMLLIGVGVAQGTVILVAQAKGSGNDQLCGHIWRSGLIQAFLFGIIMGGICLLGEPMLLLFGQNQNIADGGGEILRWISWGFPAFMIWACTGFFLEGLGKPLPGMIIMISAVILNTLLDWMFIFGELGAPEMGAEGAALTTSIVRWIMMFALLFYLFCTINKEKLGIKGPIRDFLSIAKQHGKIGLPLGVQRGLEAASFSALTMFAGWLGTNALASYQIAFNLIALAFMCAIGTAGACTVRVGNAVGRNSPDDLVKAGLSGIIIVIFIMVIVMIFYTTAAESLANIYTNDLLVSEIAAALIVLAGIILVFDGLQAVLIGCLRGTSDVWIPSFLQIFAWWGLTVPIGWYLSLHTDLGAKGLMLAFLIGSIAASILLGFRFYKISRNSSKSPQNL